MRSDSNGTQTVRELYSYLVLGTPLTPVIDSGLANRMQWKGMVYEGDSTRLYYARARWYDPQQGRFMTEDPIGAAGGLNQYVFAGGDHINGRDPTGQCGTPDADMNDGIYAWDLATGVFECGGDTNDSNVTNAPKYVAPDSVTVHSFELDFTDQNDSLHIFYLQDATFYLYQNSESAPGPKGINAVYQLVSWTQYKSSVPGDVLIAARFVPIQSTLQQGIGAGNYIGGFQQNGPVNGFFYYGSQP